MLQKKRLIIALVLTIILGLTKQTTLAQTLKEAYEGQFLIGAALSRDQVMGNDSQAMELVRKQFNTITNENLLKWESIHPEPGRYDFEAADKYVEFGERHGMFIVGHTLVWHNQTPDWVFEDADGNLLEREALLERMRDHIHTVVGRYKGKIHAWDVVNEAIVIQRGNESEGAWRESKWRQIIGPDYLEKAFQFAHEADPDAELYYNDYDEWKVGKRKLFRQLVEQFREKGIRIDGLGLQGHWGLDYPQLREIEAMFEDLSTLDVKLMVTELDVNVLPSPSRNTGAEVTDRFQARSELNPYSENLPDEVQQQLSDRYREFFQIFHQYRDSIHRITFWGVDDGQSWRNYWPIRGRTNYPLLFDRQYQPKPAYHAVIEVAREE